MNTQFDDQRSKANLPLTDPQLNRMIGGEQPRFELYHFALSLCSQKVRACLAEKRECYIAHDLNIQPGNYHPDYIRLRLLGRAGRPMATAYTGRSSTDSEGFDPAVVPTLLDLETKQVHVDSAAICQHIDDAGDRTPGLIPASSAQDIKAEIAIVDATPHVALLYGAHPDLDFRPERIQSVMPGVHDRKIAKLRKIREQIQGDADLEAAIDAKISKENAARTFVATEDRMRSTVREVLAIVAALDTRLSDGRHWVCGDTFSLADIMWSVSLFRLKWIGMAFAWQGEHALHTGRKTFVETYANRLFERPSFKAAVIDWPGVPKSEYVMDHYSADDDVG